MNLLHRDEPVIGARTPLPFDTLPGYKPVLGGLRHLTYLDQRPGDGTVVLLRCLDAYEVGTRPEGVPVYDCHACAEGLDP